jgi:hypothetical protein
MSRAHPHDLYRPTRYDGLLSLAILGLSVWMVFPLSRTLATRSGTASVYADGHLVYRLDLTRDGNALLLDGALAVEVRDRRVRVSQSSCPCKLCQQMGWIGRASESIVCAPNRVLIVIGAGGQSSECDAVSH